jgi:manganese transport protein
LTRDIKHEDRVILKQSINYAIYDSTLSLCGALFVNAAILILSAATFYKYGYHDVVTLEQAYQLLAPLLGSQAGQILFGVALLASGLNATLTGTLTGQIVMEGFANWSISPVYRRIFTRFLAIIPAIVAVSVGGEQMTNELLIMTQVILSIALPFAVFPLVHVTGRKDIMGEFVNSRILNIISYSLAFLILALNIVLFISL